MNEIAQLPSNVVAEQKVLGAMMLWPGGIEKAGSLDPEYFSHRLHGRLFAAMQQIAADGRQPKPGLVRAHVADDEDMREAGGDRYLAHLCGVGCGLEMLSDYAGEVLDEWLRRRVIAVADATALAARTKPGAGAHIREAIAALDDLGRRVGEDGLRSVEHYRDDVMALYRGERKPCISTGFADLDEFYKIRLGELSVVTGHPSSGKSELVDAIAVSLADRHGWKFALCSFENAPDEHIAKLCEKRLGQRFYGYSRMGEGDLATAMAWVHEHFHFIRAERDAPTIQWALARAKQAAERFGTRGLILDPYNEFEHQRPREMREDEYISQSLSAVKRFASGYQHHVWFIAHPQKPPHDKRGDPPGLYDISGGAAWVTKADCGLVVHRKWDGKELSSDTDVLVRKVRFSAVGKPGHVTLAYNSLTRRYESGGYDGRVADDEGD